jgi:nucleotide-binding universal stress UspA family protein
MKLLIPVDVWQEETNSHLCQDLERMVPLSDASIILVYAVQSEPHLEKANVSTAAAYGPDNFYTELEKKAKKHLDDLAKELKPACADIEVIFEHGSLAKVIESVAKDKQASLTIIRGSSAGLLESVFLGNTVSHLIRHSHNSVLVLRSGIVAEPLQKVMIALDGSDQSKTAMRQFCNFYKSMKEQIEVVLAHVVSIPGAWRFISPIEFVATLEDNLDMAGKAILAEGEAILLECGWKPKKMPVPMIVRTGDPAAELDRLAAEVDAGLIVLGAQGKNAVQSFLLGSVTEALTLKSGFPILVFK